MAVSLGAVFFGVGSYIGNGPNFMLEAMADRSKVHTSGFIGYMVRFSIPVLLPILILVGWSCWAAKMNGVYFTGGVQNVPSMARSEPLGLLK
jgi:Na+/H+ antiporter NhaD/arsenite permease-like protein